ncbi:MAG: hypothetical protein JXR05_14765 [Flavobacteriaceae bacterium]
MKFKFILHFSIRIIIAFIFFTAVGTLLHELGHIAAAKYFGYKTTLHYGSMNYTYAEKENDLIYIEYQKLFNENIQAIKNGEYFNEQEKYLKSVAQLKEKYPYPKPNTFWIVLGGPIQTIMMSFLGLFILFYRRSKTKQYFVILDWLGVFLALFILREVFNFVMAIYSSFIYGKINFYGDEYRISRMLGYNEWFIPSITFLIGVGISIYVIFKVIPIKYRFTFIISGLIGGVSGFVIWFGFLGKLLLP